MKKKYIFLGFLVLLAGLYGAYLFQFKYLGNVNVVTDGVAYRSGQLGEERLREVIAEYKIASVLNLRGKTPEKDWYNDEVKVCDELGVKHYDVGIRGRFEPPPDKVEAILKVLRESPKPILIHCKAGADRAGLVSAIWKLVIEGKNKQESESELSIRYGHLPFGQTEPLDRFFDRYADEFLSGR